MAYARPETTGKHHVGQAQYLKQALHAQMGFLFTESCLIPHTHEKERYV